MRSFLSLALLSFALSAQDAPLFPDRVLVLDQTLVRNGSALCEWGFLEIDLWRASLYVPTPSGDPNVHLDPKVPKRLWKRFERSLNKSQLGEAWTASVKANAGPAERRYRRRLAILNDMMVDVREGDRMEFDHLPGQGLFVKVKDNPGRLIPGDDFATLFFQMFLGEKPPTAQVKRGLLGGKGE